MSSIWGHVQPPGHFYDMAGMIHNYIAWTRPEGHYPGRDGKWVAVLPTLRAPLPGAEATGKPTHRTRRRTA